MIMLSLLVALQALGGTQWEESKTESLRFIIDMLFTITGPVARGGFNPNEIAGAMTWLLPLMAGVAIYRWQTRGIRWDVTLAFLMLLGAMLLGQSRSAIAGVIVALILIVWFLLRKGWRILGWILIIAIIALEVSIHAETLIPSSRRPNPPQSGEQVQTEPQPVTQAESTLQLRSDIWNSALEITRDHPFFGVGLSMFRIIGFVNNIQSQAWRDVSLRTRITNICRSQRIWVCGVNRIPVALCCNLLDAFTGVEEWH